MAVTAFDASIKPQAWRVEPDLDGINFALTLEVLKIFGTKPYLLRATSSLPVDSSTVSIEGALNDMIDEVNSATEPV